MKLFVVRHGESEGNLDENRSNFWHDTSLTEKGRYQAALAADVIAKKLVKIGKIASSPLLRANETTSIMCRSLGLDYEIDERLTELSFGDWNNEKIIDHRQKLREMSGEERATFVPPDGESLVDAAKRMAELVGDLEQEQAGAVILVSHREPIRAVVGLLTDIPSSNWLNHDFANGSVSELVGSEDSYRFKGYINPLVAKIS